MPVYLQFSKESRKEFLQSNCNNQGQASVEKSDVKKSDAIPRGPMGEIARLER